MTVIELPDEQAAALEARAAAQGLSLLCWLGRMAEEDGRAAFDSRATKQSAMAAILDLQKNVKPDPEGWTIRDYIEDGRR